ncbi:RNA-binding protein 34-like [Cataglyphis hispanica]|uniref:RNA-binding protein 34-like n=1 Tax=Cataglyphis hispanica TaxID=1086592 RepID=UPI0021806FC3|nr:RNA-binding protein 34-like [Cataglyphis hispanica]
MGRAKRQNKDMKNAKQQLHTIKNGSVKKDKNPKFKNTPVGKVALINNSKAQNKNVSSQKNVQKDVGIKNNKNLSKNNAKQSKQNSAKNKQNSPNGAQNKPANKKANLTPTKELEEIDDSDSDIDEKIILQEDVSVDETFEDEEESDTDIPDIFGQSLQDESDEDDEDFEEEEEEDNDDCDNDVKGGLVECKSVKVLKGVKPKAKDNEDNKNKNDENKKLRQVTMEDDEDDEDDDEDDEDEDENENLDLHKYIFEENLEDESNEDDEDFEEEEEEEDNDDDDDSNEDDKIKGETLIHKGVKMFKGVKSQVENSEDEDDDDDDEDDDDDDDDDDDGENEDSTLGLKALLGNSIADEDDDEDFNEEDEDDEDDDISDEDEDGEENDNTVKITKEKTAKISNSKDILKGQKQVKEGEKKLSSEEQEEIAKRTIFIDNIPKETKETEIRKVFSKFGPINNLRFRGIVPQDTKMSKKVAAIKKQIHPKVTTVVVFINYKSEESAQKALSMNGKIFEGNYIHVKIVDKSEKKEWDSKKAVFIGNLKFGIENNTIWKEFSKCGEIDSVHLVRDKQTGQTKGFGYVNFKTEESAALALKLDGVEIMKRPIRVKPHVSGHNRKGEKRVSSNDNEGNPRKKFKNNLEKPVACKGENEANIKKHQKSQKNNAKSAEQKLNSFLGQKADSKNKKKENKIDKKKKQMAKKLTAQSNKPVKV